MAALKLQHFHPSSPPSPNTHLQSTSTKSNLSFTISTYTPLTFHKTHLYPLTLPLSRKCLSTTTTQQEVSLEEEQDLVLRHTQKEDLKKKLFVVGLPWSFSASDVKSFFSECGTVTDVEIIKREDGKRGFVFVTMSSGEEAVAVIHKFDSHEVEGRIIKVEYSKTFKKPTPPLSPTYSNETRHKLFVSNLAWKARATNLKEFFADFSPVSTRIVFSASGSSAGYGFVSFATKEEAESAVSTLNGKVADKICIVFACTIYLARFVLIATSFSHKSLLKGCLSKPYKLPQKTTTTTAYPISPERGRYISFRKSIGVKLKEEAEFIEGEVVEIKIDPGC
nr:33 kDa ribonucleoprotein, chloroplastic-like [Tanacetum cinerariifolium]